MKPLATTATDMKRSGIREVMELAAQMDDVIHLEVGEPDFATPSSVVAGAASAAREGYTKYAPNAGLASLRAALVRKLHDVNRLDVSVDQVVVTPGAVCALATSVLATVNAGDQVLIPDPGWPNYVSMVQLAGGEPVLYPLDRRGGYSPDLNQLERLVSSRTKLLILNSPSNPAGAVFSADTTRALVEFARRNDLYVLSDEVYEAFVFDGSHSPASAYDTDGRVITVSGFSKTYAMTGWRVGYAVASAAIAPVIAKLQEPLVSCASSVSQKAAEAALETVDEVQIKAMRDAYRDRRDAAAAILGDAGLLASIPQGAFYALVDLSAVESDTAILAKRLLREERVATAPGETFGPSGRGLVRISLASSIESVREGCERILRFANSA